MKTKGDELISLHHVVENREPNFEGELVFQTTTLAGLTKREYFAAMAMQGLCASEGVSYGSNHLTNYAVEHADALIATLNKE